MKHNTKSTEGALRFGEPCTDVQRFLDFAVFDKHPICVRRLLFLLSLLYLPFVGWAQPSEDLDQQLFLIDELLQKAQYTESDVTLEQMASQCLDMSKNTRYETGIVRASIILGDVYLRAGRFEKSLNHYLEAENSAKKAGNKKYLPTIHASMGDLYARQKYYGNARRFYGRSLLEAPDDDVVLEKYADAALADSKFDTAEIAYKKLIVKNKEAGNHSRLLRIYEKLATQYQYSGNSGKALYYYLRIEDLVERFGQPFERGRLYNNLGKLYANLNDYRKALEYFRKTELQCEFAANTDHGCETPEVFYANMGIALHNTGDTKGGLSYLANAEKIFKTRNDKIGLASLKHLIAGVHFSSNDLYNALIYNDESILLAKETKQSDVLLRAYKTAAQIHQELYDFENAFNAYQNYIKLLETSLETDNKNQVLFAERNSELRKAEGEIRFRIAQEEIKDRDFREARNEQDRLELINRALASEAREREQEVVLLVKQTEVNQALLREKTAQALQADQKLLLAGQQLLLSAKELDAQKKQAIILEYDQEAKLNEAQERDREKEVELLRRDKDISELRLRERANFERNTYIIGFFGALSLLVFGIAWFYARRAGKRLRIQNHKIEAQRDQIEIERGKSDRLLRNILPEEIATELKTRGHADPKFYESATVVFTDFVNFTSLSANLTPEQLISELDECFLAFDEIIDRYGLEKIKTIGDAYMCAGGIPIANDTHPVDAVRAALDMSAWLRHRNVENPNALFREMRIGIHTGPVIAGVIGKNKFAYDIWGDAVNIAARLEELGEADRVNVSRTTYEAVRHQFTSTYRGQKEVHNKGLIEMYFIENEGSSISHQRR